jgi:hypothetical protein
MVFSISSSNLAAKAYNFNFDELPIATISLEGIRRKFSEYCRILRTDGNNMNENDRQRLEGARDWYLALYHYIIKKNKPVQEITAQ